MSATILDCGCYIREGGGRVWCPTCADGGPPGPRFTDADFDFLGALAADLLRRIWEKNPDMVLGAFDPFVLGETEDGEFAVWRGQPDERTPALATFGSYEEGVEEAVAWIVAHRNDAGPARSGRADTQKASER